MSRSSYPTVKFFGALLCAAASLVVAGARAEAHVRMDMPIARNMQDGYKPTRSPGFVLPCGIARAAAQPVNMLAAGSTIGMKFTETIYHPGCFIIDFAKEDTGPNTMFTRLQIEPHAAGTGGNKIYQVSVKLPDEPCTNCILRVRQYMRGAATCPPVNLVDTNPDLYYSCANVVLTGGGAGTDGGTDVASDAPASVDLAADKPPAGSGGAPGTGGAGSGGTTGSGGSASGGAPGSGGASAGSGGSAMPPDAGGGCALGGSPLGAASLPVGLAVAVLLLARRRRAAQRRG